MYSHSTRGTEVATTEGQWLLSKLPEYVTHKNPGNSPKAHAPTLCISIMFVMSLNDITIICFPLLVGNPCACAGEPCWLACTPTSIPPSSSSTGMHRPEPCWLACTPAGTPPNCSSTAMHGPSCQFRIPNFEPVTHTNMPTIISISRN